jgi:hypothetical protein
MINQLELFSMTAPSGFPIGLTFSLSHPCDNCGTTITVIGASKGPHYGSLRCRNCDGFRGWMSGATFHFVTDIIDHFGRPTEPIMATMPSTDTL